MKKILSVFVMALFLSGCMSSQAADQKDQIQNSIESRAYQEIETSLTGDQVDDLNPLNDIADEISRLERKGFVFWSDQDHKVQGRVPMQTLQPKYECKNNSKSDCSMVGLLAHKDNLPEGFAVEECDSDDKCLVTEPEFRADLMNSFKQLAGVYGFGGDIYSIGSVEEGDPYSIYKNDQEIFSHKMYFGAESVIEDASVVMGSPAFTFYDLKEWKDENTPVVSRNIWYNGETMNEKYAMEASSHLFSYQGKTGFVAEKGGKKFFFFNGQKVSGYFDEIRTNGCCMASAYPIEFDERGILFFLGRRGESYFLAEVDLNEYLD